MAGLQMSPTTSALDVVARLILSTAGQSVDKEHASLDVIFCYCNLGYFHIMVFSPALLDLQMVLPCFKFTQT